jgi:hypothetical protein
MSLIEWMLILFFVVPIAGALLFAEAVVIKCKIREEESRNGKIIA